MPSSMRGRIVTRTNAVTASIPLSMYSAPINAATEEEHSLSFQSMTIIDEEELTFYAVRQHALGIQSMNTNIAKIGTEAQLSSYLR